MEDKPMNTRRLTRAALTLLLLFAANVLAQPQPQPANAPARKIGYCVLLRDAPLYAGKSVRVKATFTATYDFSSPLIFLDNPCRKGPRIGDQVWVDLSRVQKNPGKSKVIKKIAALLKALDKKGKALYEKTSRSLESPAKREIPYVKAEVVLVGEFEGAEVERLDFEDRSLVYAVMYGHLSAYNYQLRVESIESVRVLANKT
jgi:hypothetical protein